jgi:hypothetical protein
VPYSQTIDITAQMIFLEIQQVNRTLFKEEPQQHKVACVVAGLCAAAALL